ncbi:NADH-ubiquinone oxidoreductase-F iron-sulfur binding region domain-containing protein [Halocatena pleomorpha]|uniref:NADH dehydrogenase FAD-containing subunit n=1 Tax=Halocatena pleomorpha TaxID=1785090 RepID=A0A3P3RDT9_9EURY|nr:NADH-ubiquinone oxidoreductase-F iron-sulfur binding region domain-containing protein [Halocatena pleomorpha]RRJ31504.1 NADH dehydrogenase FAD-containing subunit [Halocatena pleomorpha]
MAQNGSIEEDTIIRVSTGGKNRIRGREVLHAACEPKASVPIVEVGPTGIQELEPLILATYQGETAFYPQCSLMRVRDLVVALDDGSLPTTGAMAVTEHDPATATLPTPDEGVFALGQRRVLDRSGWILPANTNDYVASRDFLAATVADQATEWLSTLDDTGLRGRGRGDGSCDTRIADAWRTVREISRERDADPVVVVNGNEADPDAEMDRLLLESNPLAVLDAALAAARIIGATNLLVYLNETEDLARDRVNEAAAELTNKVGADIPIEAIAGPDEYTAGELTMAIEALEGNHRLEARLRPPFPREEGLYGRPTLIHTPRTLAQIRAFFVDGGDGIGNDSDPGTRLVTVAGDVETPMTLELATNDTLSVVEHAVKLDGRLKAACVGGVFGGMTRTLDVPAHTNALAAANLGTNGVIELFDQDRCMLSVVGHRASFAEKENCGRCFPCRGGTQQLADMLRDIYDGTFDAEKIRELLRVMHRSSICQFGRDAQRPVATAMNEFESEFRAHADGRCPNGVCTP